MVFKKRHKIVSYFFKDSYISFQLKGGDWMSGIITRIGTDSLYLKKERIQNSLLGADTAHYGGFVFALADIAAMPRRGLAIHEVNGQYTIDRGAGHMHFWWVKSGWIFRTGAAGYVGLNLLNRLIDKKPAFNPQAFAVAGLVFTGGLILKKAYKVTLPLGHTYYLKTFVYNP